MGHRKQEKAGRKVTGITTYGPHETEEISQLFKDKKQVEQGNMKAILMDQMKGRKEFQDMEREVDRVLEMANLEKIGKLEKEVVSGAK